MSKNEEGKIIKPDFSDVGKKEARRERMRPLLEEISGLVGALELCHVILDRSRKAGATNWRSTRERVLAEIATFDSRFQKEVGKLEGRTMSHEYQELDFKVRQIISEIESTLAPDVGNLEVAEDLNRVTEEVKKGIDELNALIDEYGL